MHTSFFSVSLSLSRSLPFPFNKPLLTQNTQKIALAIFLHLAFLTGAYHSTIAILTIFPKANVGLLTINNYLLYQLYKKSIQPLMQEINTLCAFQQ